MVSLKSLIKLNQNSNKIIFLPIAIVILTLAIGLENRSCNYNGFWKIYLGAILNYKFNFTIYENVLIEFDKQVISENFNNQVSCAMNEVNAKNLINDFVGLVEFSNEMFFMPASDYNYGIVSLNNEKRVKISFLPDLIGNIHVEDIVIVKIESDKFEWYRYDFNNKKFLNQNDTCLRCHIQKINNNYLFNKEKYIKLK